MKTISCIRKCSIIILLIIFFHSCSAHSPHNYSYISVSMKDRSGAELRPLETSEKLTIPNKIDVSDGLTEDEAVAIALWNNPQFQSDLTLLGFSRADLIDAGLLRNPVFSLLFPIGPKQMEYSMSFPVDFFWQRPYRVAFAKIEAEKVAESLIQNGLKLVSTVRIACADLNAAKEKAVIAAEEAALEEEIASIASARLRVGDISDIENAAFHLKASEIREKSIQYSHDANLEEIRLNRLLGFSINNPDIKIIYPQIRSINPEDTEEMIKKSLAARPDLRAAELSMESAGKKIGWETSKIFSLTAMIDANAEGKEGFEIGPGLQLNLPIFNWNSGNRTRAQAELEQAAMNYQTVRQKIISEVSQALDDCMRAKETFEVLQNNHIPSAELAVRKATLSYESGEISYLDLLEFKRQLLKAHTSKADGEAAIRRSLANLQYSMGFDYPDME